MNLSKKSLISMSLVIIFLIFLFVTNVYAAPQGGEIAVGEADISQQENITDINQSTDKAAINWQSFGIDVGEVVNFHQPGTDSITLNRVLGNEKSIIDGALNANGQVWLLNSNGVLFGRNAAVNTSGLLATTKELSDENFMAGNYDFNGDSQKTVINRGTIDIENSGYIALLGKEVVNEGLIRAELGEVHLKGGKEFTLDLNGNSIVNLTVTKGELEALVVNKEAIIADGGEVYLTTNAVDELLEGVVNNEGIVEARTLDDVVGDNGDFIAKEGKIELFAHGGTANISGRLDVSAPDGGSGGFIETSGKRFNVDASAVILADKWLIDPSDLIVSDSTSYENSLNSGTDIEISTDVGNIHIDDDISWNAASKLTLTAANNVNVNSVIENTNDSIGGVYFSAANDVIFGTGGKIIVNNVHQLQWINSALNRTDGELVGAYELGSDIDASDTSTWNDGKGFAPIGDDTNKFTGIFNGGGYTVDRLFINRPLEDYVGLFGSVYYGNKEVSQIKDLNLTNADIAGSNSVGGLAGKISVAKIENVSLSGNVSGSVNIGGIVGFVDYNGVVDNNNSSVQLEGSRNIGGLVGRMRNGNITNSYSHGSVSGFDIISQYVGGLAGNVEKGYISGSYSTVDVEGNQYVGGLVGYINNGGSGPGGYIENNYATGQVTGDTHVGGLVGWSNYGTLKNNYATGKVDGNDAVGGLLGTDKYNSNFLNNNFWNIETSGIESSAGQGTGKVEGLTTAGMEDASSFSAWNNDSTVWSFGLAEEIEGYGYSRPFLVNVTAEEDIPEQSQLFAGGWGGLTETGDGIVGADGSAYVIADWYQLDNIRLVMDEHEFAFALNNNLDEQRSGYDELVNTEEGFAPIGDGRGSFTGSFDGQNYTIDSLKINRPHATQVGLFGYTNGAELKNLKLTNVNIQGQTELSEQGQTESNERIDFNPGIGALAGVAENTHIENIIIDGGQVAGKVYVGGLVGQIGNAVETIENSHIMNLAVTGIGGEFGVVGGLVGFLRDSTITGSTSAGTISGPGAVGGLVGAAIGVALDSRIYSSSSSATISKNSTRSVSDPALSSFGGLVGIVMDRITIENSFATGNLSFDNKGDVIAGGLVGMAQGLPVYEANIVDRSPANTVRIEKSYATGDIVLVGDGIATAGGLVGAMESANIKNSFATGDIVYEKSIDMRVMLPGPILQDEWSCAGGLVGYLLYDNSKIENSYAANTINHDNSTVDMSGVVGGLVGSFQEKVKLESIELRRVPIEMPEPQVTNCFYDKTINPGMKDEARYGKTSMQLKTLRILSIPDGEEVWGFGRGEEVEGYEVCYPYLVDVTREEDISGIKLLYHQGYGTESAPYLIDDWEELNDIRYTADRDFYYQLNSDLSENSSKYADYVKDSEGNPVNRTGWKPIGDYFYRFNDNGLSPFAGIFDGAGHTIRDLYITGNSSNLGLFGVVQNAEIRDLTIDNVEIRGFNFIGALAGEARNNTHIENVHTDGLLEGNYAIGGLVGRLNNSVGTIKNSSSTGTVKASSNVGGLVGEVYNGTIENSFSEAEVIYTEALISASLSDWGDLSIMRPPLSDNFGGLVGYVCYSTIKNSYARGKVEAAEANKVGGLVGRSTDSTIETSYAANIVTGNEQVGGLVGYMTVRGQYQKTIKKEEMEVKLMQPEPGEPLENEIIDSFYDKTINPGMKDEAIYGKTTKELQDITTFAGWDIADDSTLKKGYPVLSGEADPVWLIGTKRVGEETDKEETIDGSNYIRDIYIAIPVPPQSDFTPDDVITHITSLPGVISASEETARSTGSNRVIYLSELLSGQDQDIGSSNSNGTDGTNSGDDVVVQVIRVRIAQNSLIELVNGGVSLPDGVDQIFFIADEV